MAITGSYYMRARYVYLVQTFMTRQRKCPMGTPVLYHKFKDVQVAHGFPNKQNLYDFIRRSCKKLTPLGTKSATKFGNLFIQRVQIKLPVWIQRSRKLLGRPILQ